MSDSPESVEDKIAHLEAQRKLLGDAAVDAAIAALQAQATTTQIAAQSEHVAQASDHSQATQGSAEVGGSGRVQGANVGVNQGTIQTFFGSQPPENGKDLLDHYLRSLIEQYGHLRLGKLLSNDQSGREEATAPTLSLRKVYTSLTTDSRLQIREGVIARVAAQDVLKQMESHNPQQVLPEQVRLPILRLAEEKLAGHERPLPTILSATEPLTTQWTTTQRQLHQERRRQSVSGHWYQPELAVKAIGSYKRLVLLGAPGSGKSTVLRYLTISLAEVLLSGETKRRWPVPLFCQLGRVVQRFDDHPANDVAHLVAALLHAVDPAGILDGIRSTLLTAWRKGGVLLCLDGLDEVSSLPAPTSASPRSPRERIADAIRILAPQMGDSRMVVTCRTKPYEQNAAWHLGDHWTVRMLEPFTFGQVRHFVPAWYQQTCQSTQPKYTPDEAVQRAERLIGVLERRDHLHELTASPLLLTE